MKKTVIGLGGSLRKESFNHQLLEACVGLMPDSANLEVIRLANFEVPLYNADLENTSGLPQGVCDIQDKFAAADGILIASPEYNGHYTGVLKNLLDWMSRPRESLGSKHGLWGKPVAIISASPGALGGIRQEPGLRVLLSHLGMYVYPQFYGVGKCSTIIQNSQINDDTVKEKLTSQLSGFTQFIESLASIDI